MSPQRAIAVDPLPRRAAVRLGGIAVIAAALWSGLLAGGHLDYEGSPWRKWPGKVSGLIGYAADDIRISGLVHHDPARVLAALKVEPGGSLLGFDAAEARDTLQGQDWVLSAKVLRLHPNQLEIHLVERQPVAVWQNGGSYQVIDRTGTAMPSLTPPEAADLLLVTGNGAEKEAGHLINLLEAHPALKSRVKAASRVGMRRWTLHLDNGVRIALPEEEPDQALSEAERLDGEYGLLAKGIVMLDLRLKDRATVELAGPVAGAVKVSRR